MSKVRRAFLQQQNPFTAYIHLLVQAMLDSYTNKAFFYYQVTCFDLRPGPANIEDTKTTKSQEEEPCVCYTTTKISVSVLVTISVTIVFYLIFKCKTKFRK